MKHEELVEEAKKAVSAVHGDKSVPRSTTRASLEDIAGDIDIMLDALRADEESEGEQS